MAAFNEPLEFEHISLERPDQQIRLLKLLPGENDDNIRCQLKVVDIFTSDTSHGDSPSRPVDPYCAVSYTWGSESQPQQIWIDGRHLTVRRNCWYALQQARHLVPELPIWIDSICIDQGNSNDRRPEAVRDAALREKSSQVRMMDKIYRTAQDTLVSLGPHLDDSNYLFYASTYVDQEPSPPEPRDQSEPFNPEDFDYEGVLKAYWADCDYTRLASSLTAFMSRPYWTRIWIVQELILSDNPIIVCGYDTIAPERLMTMFSWFSHTIRSPTVSRAFVPLSLHEDFGRQKGSPRMTLDSVVNDFQHCLCADLRDRIYGMLGIVTISDEKMQELNPDYSPSNTRMKLLQHLLDVDVIGYRKEAEEFMTNLSNFMEALHLFMDDANHEETTMVLERRPSRSQELLLPNEPSFPKLDGELTSHTFNGLEMPLFCILKADTAGRLSPRGIDISAIPAPTPNNPWKLGGAVFHNTRPFYWGESLYGWLPQIAQDGDIVVCARRNPTSERPDFDHFVLDIHVVLRPVHTKIRRVLFEIIGPAVMRDYREYEGSLSSQQRTHSPRLGYPYQCWNSSMKVSFDSEDLILMLALNHSVSPRPNPRNYHPVRGDINSYNALFSTPLTRTRWSSYGTHMFLDERDYKLEGGLPFPYINYAKYDGRGTPQWVNPIDC